MPIAAPRKFYAWSYSRLGDYEKCPAQAGFKHLGLPDGRKLKEPSTKALDNGSYVHKVAEAHSTDNWELTLPKELKAFEPKWEEAKQLSLSGETPVELDRYQAEFDGLREIKHLLKTEQDLALDVQWRPTGWFEKNAWLRIKMDLFFDLIEKGLRMIIDHKTGKIRPENVDQLELYAVGGLAYSPKAIKKYRAELWYLDQGQTVDAEFSRRDAEQLKAKWEKRVTPMLNDTTFEATPGDHCRWCFFGQSGKGKGGPGVCKF